MIHLPLELEVTHVVLLDSKYEWSASIEIGDRFANYVLQIEVG